MAQQIVLTANYNYVNNIMIILAQLLSVWVVPIWSICYVPRRPRLGPAWTYKLFMIRMYEAFNFRVKSVILGDIFSESDDYVYTLFICHGTDIKEMSILNIFIYTEN